MSTRKKRPSLKAKKSDLFKNIKVNIYEESYLHEDKKMVRTSTTLNYQICNFYFGQTLHRDEYNKMHLSLTDAARAKYRKWLEAKVQEWANDKHIALASRLEERLLQELYEHGYQKGLDRNKDNLGLL